MPVINIYEIGYKYGNLASTGYNSNIILHQYYIYYYTEYDNINSIIF